MIDCELIRKIKPGDKFYWATDLGVAEEFILDHFEEGNKRSTECIDVYAKIGEGSVIFAGMVSPDAFNKYLFLSKREARRAAREFARQANEGDLHE